MKTTPSLSVLLIACLIALTMACQPDEVNQAFAQENAPYTAQFAFKTQSQQFATDAQGRNILKVVIEGTGSFSFAGNVIFTDAFDFVPATGAAFHQVTFTTPAGDKLYTTMTTQVGPTSIAGTTTFTGGTGRFAKIKGSSPSIGPPLSATGEGSWKEEGGTITF